MIWNKSIIIKSIIIFILEQSLECQNMPENKNETVTL